MTNLSVNLNKVALLRNQRDIGYPSVIETAEMVLEAGAHGITVHPRPDERHIRKSDVYEVADFITAWPDTSIEYNIEGYPSPDFIEMVCAVPCHQVTLVPDAPDQNTSDHGWDIVKYKDLLEDVIHKLHEAEKRVSLFIDPDPSIPMLAQDVGADRVELYTGPYAFDTIPLETYVETAKACQNAGIAVNAGHDLNLDNLGGFIQAIPDCAEVSIGHAITADALKYGWLDAVKKYLSLLTAYPEG